MAGDLWPQVGQLGGVAVVVAFMARWVWGIERDMIRRYAARTVELEKHCEELEEEIERWREAYYTLRESRWNNGK